MLKSRLTSLCKTISIFNGRVSFRQTFQRQRFWRLTSSLTYSRHLWRLDVIFASVSAKQADVREDEPNVSWSKKCSYFSVKLKKKEEEEKKKKRNIFKPKCNRRRKTMQENDSVMVVRFELKIPSLGITVRHHSACNGCSVRIENFVTRVTVRHHEACRVMPNSYPEWRNFQFEPNNHYRFFFLHTLPSTIAFRLEYVLFYQLYAKITTFFSIKKRSVRLLGRRLVWRKLTRKWRQDVKDDVSTSEMMSNVKIVILTSCTRVVLHPSCKTTFPSPGRVHENPGRVCKKRDVRYDDTISLDQTSSILNVFRSLIDLSWLIWKTSIPCPLCVW